MLCLSDFELYSRWMPLENVEVAETSYKMLKVLSFCGRETKSLTSSNKANGANFSGEKSTIAIPGCLFFDDNTRAENVQIKSRTRSRCRPEI